MRKAGLIATAALLAMSAFGVANADLPGKHPAYIHALSDMRGARWMLNHRPGDAMVSAHEDVAITEINDAITDLKAASIDDGKNLNDHPAIDTPGDHGARLHSADDFLQKAQRDVNQEEDDPLTRDLKRRTLVHINNALKETRGAIWDVEHHH